MLLVLVLVHLILVHNSSGTSPSRGTDVLSFFPYFMRKDLFLWTYLRWKFGCYGLVQANMLGDSDNWVKANDSVTPAHIKPEWYFLFAYAILRCISNKTMGVLGLLFAIAFLLIGCVRKESGGVLGVLVFLFSFLCLTYFRGESITYFNTICSQLASFVYFMYLIFMF